MPMRRGYASSSRGVNLDGLHPNEAPPEYENLLEDHQKTSESFEEDAAACGTYNWFHDVRESGKDVIQEALSNYLILLEKEEAYSRKYMHETSAELNARVHKKTKPKKNDDSAKVAHAAFFRSEKRLKELASNATYLLQEMRSNGVNQEDPRIWEMEKFEMDLSDLTLWARAPYGYVARVADDDVVPTKTEQLHQILRRIGKVESLMQDYA